MHGDASVVKTNAMFSMGVLDMICAHGIGTIISYGVLAIYIAEHELGVGALFFAHAREECTALRQRLTQY